MSTVLYNNMWVDSYSSMRCSGLEGASVDDIGMGASTQKLVNFDQQTYSWIKYTEFACYPGYKQLISPEQILKDDRLPLHSMYEPFEKYNTPLFHTGRPNIQKKFDSPIVAQVLGKVLMGRNLPTNYDRPIPDWEEGYDIEFEINRGDHEGSVDGTIKIKNVHPDYWGSFIEGNRIWLRSGWATMYDLIFQGKVDSAHATYKSGTKTFELKCSAFEDEFIYVPVSEDILDFGKWQGMNVRDVVQAACKKFDIPIGFVQYTPDYSFNGVFIANNYTFAEIMDVVADCVNIDYNLYTQQATYVAHGTLDKRYESLYTPTAEAFSWMMYFGRLYFMQNKYVIPSGVVLTPDTGLLSFEYESSEEGEGSYKAKHLLIPIITEGFLVRIANTWMKGAPEGGVGTDFYKIIGLKHVSDKSSHYTELKLDPVEADATIEMNFYGGQQSYTPQPVKPITLPKRTPEYAQEPE